MELPAPFVEKLHLLIPDENAFQSVISTFAAPKTFAVRLNTLKASSGEILQWFKKSNIVYIPSSFFPEAFTFPNMTSRQITEWEIYKEGKVYIQSLSSMIPALAMSPQPGDMVLDMAAAPGSKTSQIAAMMKNRGTIIANDIDKRRLYKLKDVLSTLGVTNVQTSIIPGQRIWETYPEYYDNVLLDAPCSMEGRFYMHDAKSISHWSPKKVKNLAKLQKWLLRSAISATKVGGTIVYSTCTLSPEENEEVIDWILKKEKGNVIVDSVDLENVPTQKGITHWDSNKLHADIAKTLRILPTDDLEGFYIAKLRKTASNVGKKPV